MPYDVATRAKPHSRMPTSASIAGSGTSVTMEGRAGRHYRENTKRPGFRRAVGATEASPSVISTGI